MGVDGESALAAAATAWRCGECEFPDFVSVFLRSQVFAEAGASPGFVAWGEPGRGLIAVCSSLTQLSACRGAVAWFSTSGLDVARSWPAGYAMVLDPAAFHAVAVPGEVVAGFGRFFAPEEAVSA